MYRIASQTSRALASRARGTLAIPVVGPVVGQLVDPRRPAVAAAGPDRFGLDRAGLDRAGLDRELMRKAIHLLVALVPPLASVHLSLTMGLLMAGTLFYTVAEAMRLTGMRVAVVSGLTAAAARPGDAGFVLGPVTLGLGAMLALLLYPLPASAIAIYALAFGDAAASVVGMACAGRRLPLNRNKTVAGSLACFAAVFLITVALTADARLSAAVAAAAMTIEALSGRDLDNLLLPVGVGMVAQAVRMLPAA